MARDKLTDKQQVFVNEYLQCWNATEAARRAGYQGNNVTLGAVGAENLKKPLIVDAIQKRMTELTMSADEALMRLSEEARGRLVDFVGLSIDELKQHPQAHLIKKLKRTVRTAFQNDQPETIESIELEIYDAQAAIVHILKEQHLRAGEATERAEIVDNLTDEQRAERVAAILSNARQRTTSNP